MSESPPNSKRLSLTPIPSTPSNSSQMPIIPLSNAVRALALAPSPGWLLAACSCGSTGRSPGICVGAEPTYPNAPPPRFALVPRLARPLTNKQFAKGRQILLPQTTRMDPSRQLSSHLDHHSTGQCAMRPNWSQAVKMFYPIVGEQKMVHESIGRGIYAMPNSIKY